jgi:hypothetical protein
MYSKMRFRGNVCRHDGCATGKRGNVPIATYGEVWLSRIVNDRDCVNLQKVIGSG